MSTCKFEINVQNTEAIMGIMRLWVLCGLDEGSEGTAADDDCICESVVGRLEPLEE